MREKKLVEKKWQLHSTISTVKSLNLGAILAERLNLCIQGTRAKKLVRPDVMKYVLVYIMKFMKVLISQMCLHKTKNNLKMNFLLGREFL